MLNIILPILYMKRFALMLYPPYFLGKNCSYQIVFKPNYLIVTLLVVSSQVLINLNNKPIHM